MATQQWLVGAVVALSTFLGGVTVGDVAAAVVGASTDRRETCGAPAPHACKVEAKFDLRADPARLRDFEAGFAAWNASLPRNERWRLAFGGPLPGGNLTIVTFDAHASKHVGGVEIDVHWDYAGSDKLDFVWSQSIFLNYVPPLRDLVTPYRTMDVASGPFQAPLFPFQYTDRSFYDFPKGPWTEGFIEAQAFLGTADFAGRLLTIYGDGVGYGFELTVVPAPPAVLLFGTAVAAVVAVRGRAAIRRRAAAAPGTAAAGSPPAAVSG